MTIRTLKSRKRMTFSRGGKYAGMGKNTSSRIVGGGGRRVSIPRVPHTRRRG